MYKKRQNKLYNALCAYRKKSVFKFENEALLYSYSPEQGSEPWNSWSVLPWEFDPFNYRFLRRSVALLIKNYRSKKLSGAKLCYMLEILENEYGLQMFPFWHSNELHPENPFGGTKYVTIYDMQIPQEMSYVPYTVFFMVRYHLMHFKRFRKIPKKGNCKWGLRYSFFRVPTYLWSFNLHPGIIRYAWGLPQLFLWRWSAHEDDEYNSTDKFHDRQTKWYKSMKGVWKGTFFPQVDTTKHENFLRQLEQMKIGKDSENGEKQFFVDFCLSLRHKNYEYFAVDLPMLFRMRTYIGFHYLRRILYHTKEADILRFYAFAITVFVQMDTEHTDRMLNFVSWLEYLKWRGLSSPYLDTDIKESFEYLKSKTTLKFGLPVFDKIRKTFWKKKNEKNTKTPVSHGYS